MFRNHISCTHGPKPRPRGERPSLALSLQKKRHRICQPIWYKVMSGSTKRQCDRALVRPDGEPMRTAPWLISRRPQVQRQAATARCCCCTCGAEAERVNCARVRICCVRSCRAAVRGTCSHQVLRHKRAGVTGLTNEAHTKRQIDPREQRGRSREQKCHRSQACGIGAEFTAQLL
jgi:hypothetical protein